MILHDFKLKRRMSNHYKTFRFFPVSRQIITVDQFGCDGLYITTSTLLNRYYIDADDLNELQTDFSPETWLKFKIKYS